MAQDRRSQSESFERNHLSRGLRTFRSRQSAYPTTTGARSPSLPLFGFRNHEAFRARAGSRLSGAAEAGEQQLIEQATRAGVSPENFRRSMRDRYLRLSTG